MINEYNYKPRINYSTHFQKDESVGTRDSQNLFEVTPFNRHQGTSPAAPLIPSVSTAKRRAKIINEPAFRFLPLPPPSPSIYTYILFEKISRGKNWKYDDTKRTSALISRNVGNGLENRNCRTQTNFLLSRLYRARQPGLRDNLEDFYFFHCSFQFLPPRSLLRLSSTFFSLFLFSPIFLPCLE